MMMRFALGTILSLAISPALAAVCQLHVLKDSCFHNYDVTVDVYLQGAPARLFDIPIVRGQDEGLREFNCEPDQIYELKARFAPAFWQGEENRIYAQRTYMRLPQNFPANTGVWKLTTCFGRDFIGVPLPPEASSQCRCEP